MSDAFFLTAEDCNKLSRLIAEHGLTKIVHRQEDWLPGTPEVYVARPNSAAGTGTGSGATVPALTPKADGEDYDHPGYALCDIYQFTWKAAGTGTELTSTLEGNWDITPISDYSQPVFNISPTATGDTWFLIIKTKQGHWVAVWGGAAADTRGFQLLSDLDGPAIRAFANPAVWNENTHVYEDEHDGEIDPAFTVVIVDSTEQAGAWQGDWVEAEDTGERITVGISNHSTVTVTGSAAAGQYAQGAAYPPGSGFYSYSYDQYYIWFDADNSQWVISEEIGVLGDSWWAMLSIEAYPNGTFEPQGEATLNAVCKEDSTPGDYALWRLTARPSAQAEYRGGLLETLSAGGFALMRVYINVAYVEAPREYKRLIVYQSGAYGFNEGQPFLVNDWLLSSGQQVLGDPDAPPNIMVSYLSAEREWYLTGTQCYVEDA